MAGAGRRKCKCCHKLFRPDPSNRYHQRLEQPRCLAASLGSLQRTRRRLSTEKGRPACASSPALSSKHNR
jgi:hypothetical protein